MEQMGKGTSVAKLFLNINKIFPTQQEAVAEMIEVCKKIPNIRKIIIFGSSVTPRCTPESDIDIYFETAKEMNKWPSIGSHTVVFDKWDNFTVDKNLYDEIMKTGVLVYERQEHDDSVKEVMPE